MILMYDLEDNYLCEFKNYKADRITLYVDRKVYQEYKMYSIMINKSVSSLIEEYMRNVLKEMKKEK